MVLTQLMVIAAGLAALVIWARPMAWWTKVGLSATVHFLTVVIIIALQGPSQPYGRSVFYLFFHVMGAGVAVMVGAGLGWLCRRLLFGER
jgi:hypothetical protein